MKNKINYLKNFNKPLIGVFFLFLSCSTQKDALPNRLYHQINTKYNGLFYAEQYFSEGVDKIESLHKDNYKEILTINQYGDIKNAQNAQASLDQAIEKSKIAIQQHSMEIKGDEKNKLINKNYMIIGKSQFYKQDYAGAINTFNYLVRKSKDASAQSEALLWATRCHQQANNLESLRKNLILLEEEYFLNKEQDAFLDEIQAEMSIKEGYYAEAIHHLEKALKKSKNKNKQTRIHYIIGQLNLQLSDPNLIESLYHFNQVIKKNPDYEFVFNAKLMRAKTYDPKLAHSNKDRANFNDFKKSLQKMLKDVKNIEYKDQIYFALGNLELNNLDTASAINSLTLSTNYSLFNNIQKLESHYLLANIFWDKKQYIKSYHHCDSAYQLSDQKSPKYTEIKNMRRSAKKVAKQYTIINYNDSIIELASLPEKDRNEIIDNYIKELKEQDQQSKQDQANNTSNTNFNSYEFNRQSQNSMNISSGGGWYFYNPSAISLGYSEFLSRWGNRKLEDNWRRKNKNRTNMEEDLEEEDIASGPTEKEKYSRDYYISLLPLTEEEQLALLSKVELAYYELATIFKEDLEDYSQSIATYQELKERFPSTDYRQLIYFDLFSIYQIQNDTISASNIFSKIEEEFPNSKYLKVLRGDTTQNVDINLDKKLYHRAYDLYTDFTDQSCQQLKELLDTITQSDFISQIELLNAFCQARHSDKQSFIKSLNKISSKYPATSVSNRADSIVLILKGELDFNPENKFKNEFKTEHFFFFTIEDVSLNLPETQMAVSKFNNTNYKLDSLTTTNTLLNKQVQLLKVGEFKNKEAAYAYFELIQENNLTKQIFLNPKISPFIISKNNYVILVNEKDINEYQRYFNQIYLLN
ncbi:MAG: hypothetical protein CMP74_02175 [Flavobacteriales bacterium]|nr:hypothetical protein [Flavobacteriales bacterium]